MEEVLECGCEKEIVNGKIVWYYCDMHDVDVFQASVKPMKKVRKRILDEE